jgi:hypothetical protein
MGMFDTVRVELPLPDTNEIPVGVTFQTKDLGNMMDVYVIANDNKLYREEWDVAWEETPDMMFGGYMKKDEGSFRLIEVEDIHADIVFYGDHLRNNNEITWREYTARFTNGILSRMTYKDCAININKASIDTDT